MSAATGCQESTRSSIRIEPGRQGGAGAIVESTTGGSWPFLAVRRFVSLNLLAQIGTPPPPVGYLVLAERPVGLLFRCRARAGDAFVRHTGRCSGQGRRGRVRRILLTRRRTITNQLTAPAALQPTPAWMRRLCSSTRTYTNPPAPDPAEPAPPHRHSAAVAHAAVLCSWCAGLASSSYSSNRVLELEVIGRDFHRTQTRPVRLSCAVGDWPLARHSRR